MKLWKTKFGRRDSRRPLIENNNNNDENQQDGTCCDSVVAQNNSNRNEERHLQSEEQINGQPLAELLGVAPDADHIHLILSSVSQRFPNPPVDVAQNLHQHLFNVQETVHKELVKLGPLLKPMGLMECLIESYHRHTFEHLDDLLNKISSSKNFFTLMMWLRDTYLSQEPCGQSDLHEMDPMKTVDMLLFTECAAKAKDKLLEHVKKEVRGILEGILQHERSTEAYDELYLDTIQCIDAMHRTAQTISQKLSDYVQEVCFQELAMFLKCYTTVQTEKKAKMDKPETKPVFKTLNNCNKLKQYVQTKAKGTLLKETKDHSVFEETVAMLEDMKRSTLDLLMTIVNNTAKSHLKRYFKSDNKEFFLLIDEVKSLFSELSCCQDIGLQKKVTDEAYKLIAHVYLKHLILNKRSKLRRCWSPNVGQTIAEDAEILHDIFSVLAPDVRQWNLMLLKVKDLLECESSDMTKLTVGSMQIDCCTWSEDLELLPKLLQWKGLSGWEVREVLKVLEDLPGYQPTPRPRSVFWFGCLTG
ncbi:exocyst complex component 3 [Sander vitreus]